MRLQNNLVGSCRREVSAISALQHQHLANQVEVWSAAGGWDLDLDDMHTGGLESVNPTNLSSNFFLLILHTSHSRLYISPIILPRNIVSL